MFHLSLTLSDWEFFCSPSSQSPITNHFPESGKIECHFICLLKVGLLLYVGERRFYIASEKANKHSFCSHSDGALGRLQLAIQTNLLYFGGFFFFFLPPNLKSSPLVLHQEGDGKRWKTHLKELEYWGVRRHEGFPPSYSQIETCLLVHCSHPLSSRPEFIHLSQQVGCST